MTIFLRPLRHPERSQVSGRYLAKPKDLDPSITVGMTASEAGNV